MFQYKILYRDKSVGRAELEKQGMFYRICCQCNLPQNDEYRITAVSVGKSIDLGLCFPMINGIGLVTRLPAVELNLCALEFFIVQENDDLIEISEERAFQMLDRLDSAQFVSKDGDPYIRLHQISSESPTGQ